MLPSAVRTALFAVVVPNGNRDRGEKLGNWKKRVVKRKKNTHIQTNLNKRNSIYYCHYTDVRDITRVGDS